MVFVPFSVYLSVSDQTSKDTGADEHVDRRRDMRELQRQYSIVVPSVIVGAIVARLAAFVSFLVVDYDAGRQILGWTSVLMLTLFLGSPLSVMYQVIKKRDARWIYWPLSVATVINGVLWTVYGLVLLDPFIYVANIGGMCLGLTQILLLLIYRKKKKQSLDIQLVDQ
jgi:solute carrier family 50 (sugar transporter)